MGGGGGAGGGEWGMGSGYYFGIGHLQVFYLGSLLKLTFFWSINILGIFRVS